MVEKQKSNAIAQKNDGKYATMSPHMNSEAGYVSIGTKDLKNVFFTWNLNTFSFAPTIRSTPLRSPNPPEKKSFTLGRQFQSYQKKSFILFIYPLLATQNYKCVARVRVRRYLR